MNSLLTNNRSNTIFALMIGLAVFWGIASFQHYGPNNYDISVNLFVAIIASCAILYAPYTKDYNDIKLTVGSLSCIFFIILLFMQPFISDILYPDALIFPIIEMVYALLIGLLVFNNSEKNKVVNIITACIAVSAFFTVFTLLVQTFDVESLYRLIVTPIEVGGRPIGNVSQPNQAAFVLSLGMVAAFYFIDIIQSSFIKYSLFLAVLFLGIGIALTSSRTGVILIGLSILFYWGLTTGISVIAKLKLIGFYGLLSTLGYLLGDTLLAMNKVSVSTGIERFSGNLIQLRQSQFNQALLIFQDNWFKGAGWDNYASGGLERAEQVSWFSFSSHSHMIISNIASELGLLGLMGFLGIVFVLVFKFFNVSSKIESLAMTICLIILAYSFSEYPLWYLKYLVVFVVFFSVLDISIKRSFSNKPLFVAIGLLLLLGSTYYTYHYRSFLVIYTHFVNTNNQKEKIALYNSYYPAFGFTDYKESLLFGAFPIDKDQIEFKVELGSRVVMSSPVPTHLNKQAIFYGLNGQSSESLRLLKASCLYQFAESCNDTLQAVSLARDVYPIDFANIYNDFQKWRDESPDKTGLTR